MENIKDKVAIVGVGCTKFGENFDMSYKDMIVKAAVEAFNDAGVEPQQIEAAWLGTAFPEMQAGQGRSGESLIEALLLKYIPVTKIANYCCTGSDAFRNACFAVASGMYDIVLVVGVEKMRDVPPRESLVSQSVLTGHPLVSKGLTAPGQFALTANRYFHEYGIDRSYIAKIAVKNHHNGFLNPKAYLRYEVTEEEVLNAPIMAYPLGLLDCTAVDDGCAAIILTTSKLAPNFRDDFVLVKAVSLCVDQGRSILFDNNYSFIEFKATQKAAKIAYEQAGIKDPLKEIDLAEVHDCFTITEIVNYEDLGFCKKGEGGRFIADGISTLEGKLPVNPSGGLKANGHPIGATGVRQLYEVTTHLQGRAGERQVKNCKIGLTHTLGGAATIACVSILGARD